MIWKVDDKWTLFLDRDGVVNERIFGGYVKEVGAFKFRQDFLESIPFFSKKFGRIIVVTNQQGIGKGLMSERNLSEIHHYMIAEVNGIGGRIDKVYYASNQKGVQPDRRKPNPAMGQEAQSDFPEINFELAVMIGDTDGDIQFGKELGMKTVLLRSEENVQENADLQIESLNELKNIFK